MSFKLQSSNPALTKADAFNPFSYHGEAEAVGARRDVATLQGVVNKTSILIIIAVLAGAVGYSLVLKFPGIIWISAIASFVLVLGFGYVMCGKPHLARVLGPIYAVIQGVFLGALTALADYMLASRGLSVMGGVGVQAFIITMATVISMLILYKLGWVRPTKRFKAVVMTLGGAIMIAYMVSFVMSFFGPPLPLISFASTMTEFGMMGLLGLGINIFILVIASLFLIIDFGEVEKHVNAGTPKMIEWYLGFSLLVTLAWIYFEAVKLVLRLAIMFGGRD